MMGSGSRLELKKFVGTAFVALALGACSSSGDTAPRDHTGFVPGPGAGSAGQGGTFGPGADQGGPGGVDQGLPGPGQTPIDTGGGPDPINVVGTPVPCDVQGVVANACQNCHGQNPIGGAIRLVSHEDWHQASPIYGPATLGDATKKVFEVAQIRINDGSMPQGSQMTPDDLAVLDAWLSGGALAATPEEAANCVAAPPPDDDDTQRGECGAEDYLPLVATGEETCYEFRVHGVSSPTDTSKFDVASGESYHEFIYDVPWPASTVATRFGADFDNEQVLHHWLAFDYTTTLPHGTVNRNVLGTTLGANANLIGGWAVGGCNVEFPSNMGQRLPDAGHIMVQWHMYNTTGVPQPDSTAVQFCTVPSSARENTGGLTWLGTENLGGLGGMPPGMQEYFGTCINDSPGPITIVAFLPHLHTLGINMRSEVQRGGAGPWETVFDQPFDFNWQVHYNMDPPIVLQPGDRIRSTCTYFNDTGANVGFGESTNEEMCYQFAFSYPAGALDNGVLSLIGATNTCWQFGE